MSGRGFTSGGSPLTAGAGIAINSAGVVSATGGGFHLARSPALADFPTSYNAAYDGETFTAPTSGGVMQHRDGVVAVLPIAARVQPIASGTAWTVIGGFTMRANHPSRAAPAGAKFSHCGVVLTNGTALTLYSSMVEPAGTIGASVMNFTDKDTYTATGRANLIKAAGHPLYDVFPYGGPLYFRLQLVSGTVQFSWSLTGRENDWVRETTLDVVGFQGASATTITQTGIGGLANATFPYDLHLIDWSNIA